MKPQEFDLEEQELLESYERDEWKPVVNLQEELQQYQVYAAATIKRNRLVSIDLSPEDFAEIQQKAIEKGIPYQTLISNIVHQFAAGRLVEQA
ncbi:antitoxin [bacterium]|nr:antitoxin [bacterium]